MNFGFKQKIIFSVSVLLVLLVSLLVLISYNNSRKILEEVENKASSNLVSEVAQKIAVWHSNKSSLQSNYYQRRILL